MKPIPIVILTPSADQRDVQVCYRASTDTYLQKPVGFERLIDAFQRLEACWFETGLLPKETGNE